MSKVLTVFGATGLQGGSVAKAVLADPQLSKEFKVRAVTRDVTKQAAKDLAAKGAELLSVSASVAAQVPLPRAEHHRRQIWDLQRQLHPQLKGRTLSF